jgi:hypothetical protein
MLFEGLRYRRGEYKSLGKTFGEVFRFSPKPKIAPPELVAQPTVKPPEVIPVPDVLPTPAPSEESQIKELTTLVMKLARNLRAQQDTQGANFQKQRILIASREDTWTENLLNDFPRAYTSLIEVERLTSSVEDVLDYLEKNPARTIITDPLFALDENYLRRLTEQKTLEIVNSLNINPEKFAQIWEDLARLGFIDKESFQEYGKYRRVHDFPLIREVKKRFPNTKVILISSGNMNTQDLDLIEHTQEKIEPDIEFKFQADKNEIMYLTLKILAESFS